MNLLIRWYVDKNRVIHKLSPKDELRKYLMKTSKDIEEILRCEITSRTVKYFEAKTDYERSIIKGEVFALKLLKDKHLLAMNIESDKELKANQDLKLKYWREFKIKN